MGILTSDPYENAWIIVGLIAASILAIVVGIGLPGWYLFKDSTISYSKDELISTVGLLAAALLPLGIFSSGIIIDFINQTYQYSRASIVGFLGVIATTLFGSSKFADFSKSIVGFLPEAPTFKIPDPSFIAKMIPDPSDPAKMIPDPDSVAKMVTNTLPIIKWAGVWGLIIAVLSVGFGTSFGLGGTQWGEGIAIGIGVPFVLMLLAGNGLLGRFSERGTTTYGPEMGGPVTLGEAERWFTGGGLGFSNPSDYCDVPGFAWAKNFVAPPSIVLSQTIVWYHLIEDWDTKNASHSGLIGVTALVVFMLQWFTLQTKGCLNPYRSGIAAPVVGLIISIAVAGTAYGVIKNMPAYSSGSVPGPPRVDPKPLGPGGKPVCPTGYYPDPVSDSCIKKLGPGGTKFEIPIAVGGEQQTSEPVDDQDAFVCEAYKDGELVTSTIVD